MDSASTLGRDAMATPGSLDSPRPGAKLGRFHIIEPIGEGGMGMVFAAHDDRLDRKVALKVIRGDGDEGRRARMFREAQALAKLSHPNVVAIYEVGERADQLYIAMELIDGPTLRAWVRDRPAAEVLSMYLQAGRGVAAAHAHGLVHRDFKPDNVMVGRDEDGRGRARVLDFGLARLHDGAPTPEASDSGDDERPPPSGLSSGDGLHGPLTITGTRLGTPAYMAPEQFLGGPVDARTDQFSFCVSLYEALYGERPFEGRREQVLARNITEGRLRSAPRGSTVPAWLRKALCRGLATAADDRFASMDALLAALGRDPARRRWAWRAVGLGAVVVGGVWGWPHVQRIRGVAVCERQADAMALTWNEARAQALAATFESSGVPLAVQAWARTRGSIDAYAKDWTRQRVAACVATEVEHERTPEQLARARECFEDARLELSASVERLDAPDPAVVRYAPLTASRLPFIQACSDPELLGGRASPPSRPELREAVLSLRRRLSRVSVALRIPAGSEVTAEALADAEGVLADALELGWMPMVARSQLAVARALRQLGRPEQSEAMYENAFFTAGGTGQHYVALSASSALMTVVGAVQHRADDGLRWSRQAQLRIEQLGLESELPVGAYLNHLGNVHTARGAHGEALEAYERALVIIEQTLGSDHLVVGEYLLPIAHCHRALGSHELALTTLRRALAILEGNLGPDHPRVANALSVLTGIHAMRGELQQALAVQQRAIGIATAALGPEHPHVINMQANLGTVHWQLGSHGPALEAFERVRDAQVRQHGSDHPGLTETFNKIGVAHLGLGQATDALKAHQRALALADAHLGPEHPELARSLVNTANTQVVLERHDAALTNIERALAIWEATVGAEHPEYATALYVRGEALLGSGQRDAAAEVFERTATIRGRVLGPEHPGVEEAREGLRRCRAELAPIPSSAGG